MDNALQLVLELSRDPMLVLSGGRIVLMNSAAKQAFPRVRVGDGAGGLLPDPFAFDAAGTYISTAVINGVRYTVSASSADGTVYLLLAAERPVESLRGLLTERTMSGLLSSLFTIRLSADRLRSALPQAEKGARDYLAILDHNYYLLCRRLNNLNMTYALSDGSMSLVPRHVDLVSLCADVVSSTATMTRGKYAKVEFSTELETLPACLDAPKVEQLLLNLLANSLQHTPPDGWVRLKLSQSGEKACISVRDSGSGIPPEKLRSIFRCEQERPAFNAAPSEAGSGLGLCLCSAIAEKHGGTLVLESREGEGANVVVLLPLDLSGGNKLWSTPPAYENGGMSILLTELSELLDAEAYAVTLPDE